MIAVVDVRDGWTEEDDRAWLATIGMRVRLRRVVLALTQAEFAAAAGVSRVTLGSVERADHPASVLVYARLATVAGMSLAALLATDPGDLP